MQVLLIILEQIAPIFLVMAVGYGAFSLKWFDSGFVRTANTIVYRIALPALVFTSVSEADFTQPLPVREFVAFLVAIVATTAIAYGIALAIRMPQARRGAFVQGSIRGNFAIVAIAVFTQVLGPDSLPTAAIYLAFFLPLHNLFAMAVLALDRPSDGAAQSGRGRLAKGIANAIINPLTVAVYIGIVFSVLRIHLPVFVGDTLSTLKQLALPLALIGVGGSLKIYYSNNHLPVATVATVLKLVVMPIIVTIVGALLGLATGPLVMLAVFAGSPAAVATYAVADSMGADRDTAGSIIFLSHAACVVTITLAIAGVRYLFPAVSG